MSHLHHERRLLQNICSHKGLIHYKLFSMLAVEYVVQVLVVHWLSRYLLQEQLFMHLVNRSNISTALSAR